MTERMIRVHYESPDWERYPGLKPVRPYFETNESNLGHEILSTLRMGYIVTSVEFAS